MIQPTKLAADLVSGDKIGIDGHWHVVTFPSLDLPREPGRVIVHVEGQLYKADADHRFDLIA